MEFLFTKVGGWMAALFPAALGAGLAMFFKKSETLTLIEKALTFFFGVSVAYLLGGATIEWYKIIPTSFIASAIQFSIGLIGMASLAHILVMIPKVLDGIRKKYLGD
jgi:hypothetical protein